jgi:hypothetical protein
MCSRTPRDVMSGAIGAAGAGNDWAGFLAMIGNDDEVGQNFRTQTRAAGHVIVLVARRRGALPCPRR